MGAGELMISGGLRRFFKWSSKVVLVALSAVVCLVVVYLVFEPTAPLGADQTRRRDDEVNQAAAINIPHGFARGKLRAEEPLLTSKVEHDIVLDDAESAGYRAAYQQIILLEQPTLHRLDRNLTVMNNVQMDRPNNIGGIGIAGSHDYHDQSVRSNLNDLTEEVNAAENPANSSLTKVWSAILAYKDLSDTLSHLATMPHTKSTAYLPPAFKPIGYQIEGEAILRDFKSAQFASINSDAYWANLWRGLDRYDLLAIDVQTRLHRALTPFQRHLAGRWDSVQSLGPFLAQHAVPRRYRRATNSSE